ncbi:uncharacterized protein LOC114352219 [Ostrinia furnacalis]|uniref:uncharacterized protein LOC114352219 n=1 Tax=Ostrinia furnacalis TaxID=93504 RepID=UPI00103B9CF1|nr:uncharacterized protein LOC114352219 [Ostrinia furnacalis]
MKSLHAKFKQNDNFVKPLYRKVKFGNRVPETWLRVYPAPQVAHEATCSVIFRCIVCQLGLATFLVLWNILWVFVIHNFEGPYETEVSILFEKEQNQLVIDLATELRQITPLSPKWKHAIEKRIEDERQLTMLAMARGAKLHPGQFWDLSGTFLFSVYVMTALGFGAPVPQTTWGRTSALIYAVLAVPIHIYLMVNASTCVVAKVGSWVEKLRTRLEKRRHSADNGTTAGFNRESPNCRRNTELMKVKKRKAFILRRRILRFLNALCIGRCVPAAAVLYYVGGAICFGAMRGRTPLETIMFPLEFTTTGGLENVENYIRILYGFYIEGAMALLACALATLRAHSSATVNFMSDKYRLFTINKQN